jgi:N-acetylglucosaminyldiphosphoundecaprenol N-acetyl-beta-D-mannosaminyltransferase
MTKPQFSCSPLPRANVLGVGVHAVNMDIAVRTIAVAVAERRKGYICATGVHGVMEAQRNSGMLTALANALLVVPDGMPTVWMGHLQGLTSMARVFGPDLMLAVIGHPLMEGRSHFLYGGRPGVAGALQITLTRLFPKAHMSGTYTPPFRRLSHGEQLELLDLVNSLRPDIVWVGLSTPKQEQFMADFLSRMNTTLMIGVGAAFNFHTGRIKDSPAWVKRCGLQWLHRLGQEPTRLWRRYLVNNPQFLVHAALQLSGIKQYKMTVSENSITASLPTPASCRSARELL